MPEDEADEDGDEDRDDENGNPGLDNERAERKLDLREKSRPIDSPNDPLRSVNPFCSLGSRSKLHTPSSNRLNN